MMRLPALAPLPAERAAASDALRQSLEAVGSAFDFVVHTLPEAEGDATEAHHRAALQQLFERFRAQAEAHWQALVTQAPQYRTARPAPLPFDVGQALPSALDADAVVPASDFPPGHRVTVFCDAASVRWFERLAAAFDDPPYPLQAMAPDLHRALFPRFCACTGLLPDEGIVVLDWVGDPLREPERSTWSPYFDDGKEWWGIWCLTVWNPRQRTLAALAASTTD